MVVKFHNLDEFIKELEAEQANIERGIVRVSKAQRQSAKYLTTNVYLIATAKVLNGDILKLEHFVGQEWQNDDEINAITYRRFEEARDKLLSCVEKLGLTVRYGVFDID